MIDLEGNIRQLVVVAGKDENMYLADCANMGKYNPANNNALYEELANVFTGTNDTPPDAHGMSGGNWSTPAYFNGTLYFGPVRGPITAFPFQNALLSASSSTAPTVFGYPGAIPCVSASGASNGIVWAVETVGKSGFYGLPNRTAVLHAYAATNLANELYNSTEATNNRDEFGNVNDFVTPTIASGRVYVPSSEGVGVFGLLNDFALTPIQQWRDAFFGNPCNVGTGANGACPVGDGVPNLIKYALGLDPLAPATSDQLGLASVQECNGKSYLTVAINWGGNPPDVSFQAQVSSDLISWTPCSPGTVTVTNTATQLIIINNAPVGSGTNQFLRLLVLPASNS
jgi:hypothetical protein